MLGCITVTQSNTGDVIFHPFPSAKGDVVLLQQEKLVLEKGRVQSPKNYLLQMGKGEGKFMFHVHGRVAHCRVGRQELCWGLADSPLS